MQSVFIDVNDLGRETQFDHELAVLVLPFIDHEQATLVEDVLRVRALSEGLLVLVNDSRRIGFIKVANLVFSKSRSKYFGYLAQDAFPGDGWLRCAVRTLDESGGSLLAFNDGRFFGNIAAFGLLRREWAKSLYHNAVFFPGYVSHFGDTELSAIARAQGQLIFNPGCVLCEVDYQKHKKRNNPDDEALYRQRARTGFGGLAEPFDPA